MKKLKKPVSLLLSMILIFSLFTIIPVSAAETGDDAVGETRTIRYIENDGEWDTQSGCIPFTRDTKVLEAGKWYYAEGNISNWNRVVARNNAHLILLDGAYCHLHVGINVPTHVEGQSKEGEIHIYAQSTDKDVMGKLIAETATASSACSSATRNKHK